MLLYVVILRCVLVPYPPTFVLWACHPDHRRLSGAPASGSMLYFQLIRFLGLHAFACCHKPALVHKIAGRKARALPINHSTRGLGDYGE